MRGERNQTEKRGLLWIDWGILIFIALILLVGGGFVLYRYQTASPDVAVTYILCLEQVRGNEEAVERLVSTGSLVASENGTIPMGEVVSVMAKPSKAPCLRNGEVMIVPLSERFDVYVTVRAVGKEKEGDGIRVGDIRMAAGDYGNYRLGHFYAEKAKIVFVNGEEMP